MLFNPTGLAAFTAVLNIATVANASPCPLFGPDLPAPTALHDDPYVKDAVAEISKLLRPNQAGDGANPLGIDFQSTSFSVDIYSAREQRSAFTYHHIAPSLQKHGSESQVINDTTIYRIGSISKLLTAYLYLLEVGDASFNDPITQYVPELAALSAEKATASPLEVMDWRDITIGALATHMAGIPRDPPSLASADRKIAQMGFPPVIPVQMTYCGEDPSYPCNRTQFFESIRTRHPVEVAFSTPVYSNIGYQVIAYALESMTGTSYPDMLSRQLIGPLQLNSTTYYKPATTDSSIIPDSASRSGYDIDMYDAGPAGGVYSSIADLRRIGQSILAFELLPPSRTRRWMKPHSFTADPRVAVGAPWEIAQADTTTNRANWMFTKGGQVGMYNSLIALLPDLGAGFTVLAAGSRSAEITSVVPVVIASKLVPALERAGKRQATKTYGGHYRSGKSSSMEVAVQDHLPGLAVKSWSFHGQDMFGPISTLVTGFPTTAGNVSMRLYPTGLNTSSRKGAKRESWRAVYEVIDDTASSGSAELCASWFSVDSATYGGVSLDEFVFELAEDGSARSITAVAFNAPLDKECLSPTRT